MIFSRRIFLKKALFFSGFYSIKHLPTIPFLVQKNSNKKRKTYWWLGNGTHLIDTLYAENADGICIAGGKFNPESQIKNIYQLVFSNGPSEDDMTNTIENMKVHYKEGWKQLSTDLEKGYYNYERTKQFIEAIQSMPGLTVIQWNGYWNWKKPQWDLLEKCKQIILTEMVYPLVSNDRRNYEEIFAWIKRELSHYQYMPEDRHAIGLSTVCHGPKLSISDPNQILDWDKMQLQIDAAIDYGNSIGHPRQALAFYYPTPHDYAKKIMEYIRHKDNKDTPKKKIFI